MVDNRHGDTASRNLSSCSVPTCAGYSSSDNTRPAAIIADHLRGKPASAGPQAAGCHNVVASQSSCFGPASITRAADLAGPALACQRTVKEQQNRECLGGPRRPDLSVRAHSEYKVAGTRTQAMLDGFVDRFPQARSVVDAQEQTDLRLQRWCPGPLMPGSGFNVW